MSDLYTFFSIILYSISNQYLFLIDNKRVKDKE